MDKIFINKNLKNKTVLITGGTGSFGQNFAKFLLKNPDLKKLIIFDVDEFKQHKMQLELKDKRIRFLLGDVRDLPRLHRAFAQVDIVFHAAALKQIPALEYNPYEAVKTNILGSQNVIEAAIDQKVSKVILISSDKAAYPVNLYGATKLCAEKLFVSANFYSPSDTRFSVVRYGNVIASRGSIVELLLENKKTKRVSITHPEMTRFWITLEESFELVITALNNMEGGEIFIPKIPSMRLMDLVEAIAPKAKKEIIGIRPGEKLYEVLLTEEESRRALDFDKYFVVLPHFEFRERMYEKYYKIGKKLASGFKFASHTNEVWLTKSGFKKKIKEAKLI